MGRVTRGPVALFTMRDYDIKPGRSGRAWIWRQPSRPAWQSTPARLPYVLDAVGDTKHVGRDHRDLTSGLDHTGAADQAFADGRRQQVEFVFRRQRRLSPRGRGRDRGGVVHQERGDAAMKQAVLLEQLRPAIDRERAGAARQFGQSAPTRDINPCRPTLSWMRAAIGPKSGSDSLACGFSRLVDSIGREQRADGAGNKGVGFARADRCGHVPRDRRGKRFAPGR